eukprot:GILI01008010.1.p1 GENE.GILI01008010.1~~GILI01008010.1.p1  ORF type:complete len:314 (+),score=35.51 GILI01008010.1:130-942(+)
MLLEKSHESDREKVRGHYRLGQVSLAATLNLLIFCLLVASKLQTSSSKLPWSAVFIPAWIFIPLVCYGLDLYQSLALRSVHSIAKYLFRVTIYCSSILSGVWLLLIALKLDSALDQPWAVVSCPLWISFGLFLLFSCFIFPGFLFSRQVGFFLVLLSQGACLLLFSLFAVMKLDGAIQWHWATVLTPIWIALGFQLFGLLLRKYTMQTRIIAVSAWSLFLTFLVLFSARQERQISVSWFVIFIPLYILCVLGIGASWRKTRYVPPDYIFS